MVQAVTGAKAMVDGGDFGSDQLHGTRSKISE
jgi:hypothetical protein